MVNSIDSESQLKTKRKINNFIMNVLPYAIFSIFALFSTVHYIFACVNFVFCVIYIISFQKDKTIPFLIYMTYFAAIFKILPLTEMSLYTLLLPVFIFKEIFLCRFKTDFIFTFFAFFASCIIFQIINQNFDLGRNIKFFEFFFYVYIVLHTYKNEKSGLKCENILLAVIFGVIVSSLFRFLDSGLFQISRFVDEKVSTYSSSSSSIRFSGLLSDPNYYAISVHLAIGSAIFLCFKKSISYLYMISLLAVLGFLAVLTGSKSSFLMLVFPFVLLIYLNTKQKRTLMNFVLIFGAIGAIALIFSGKIPFFSYIVNRLTTGNNSLDSLTTGRTAIWRDYFTYFKENIFKLFFGNGISAPVLHKKAAHNTYIDIIYYLGIIPGMLFLYLIISFFRLNKKRFKKTIMNYIGIVIIVVMYVFLSSLFDIDLGTNIIAAVVMFTTPVGKGGLTDGLKRFDLQNTENQTIVH